MQHFMHTSANATWQTRIRRLIDEHRCHSVYLDVGSNIGVQIRKLYEPSLYVGRDPKLASLARRFKLYDEPTAEEVAAGIVTKGRAFWNSTSQVLPVFEQYFGTQPRCGVCAIGVEPNPRHTERLRTVETALRAAGFGVLWLRETAADVYSGFTTIKYKGCVSCGGKKVNDVGLRTPRDGSGLPVGLHSTRVATIDLAMLIHFVHRHLHKGRGGKIVMKLDTEGAEEWLLPHLIARHALCVPDLLFLEWHPDPPPHGTAELREARRRTLEAVKQPNCTTVVSTIDDETFFFDGKPLPTERSCHAGVRAQVAAS